MRSMHNHRLPPTVDEQEAESDVEEQEAEVDGFVGGDLHADTQRLLRGIHHTWPTQQCATHHYQPPGQAKYDALGKGHEPVIKPLAGVLSRLKMQAEVVKAKYACLLLKHTRFLCG